MHIRYLGDSMHGSAIRTVIILWFCQQYHNMSYLSRDGMTCHSMVAGLAGLQNKSAVHITLPSSPFTHPA
jgi:hypothetical protein